MIKECKNCNKNIKVANWQLKIGKGKYCNKFCMDEALKRKPKVQIKCQFCQKTKKIQHWKYKNKSCVKFCSHDCYSKSLVGKESPKKGSVWSKEQRKKCSGENSSNWRGGVTTLHQSIRRCKKYADWRKSIMSRDNYTCQICGKVGSELNVDHYPKAFAVVLHENKINSKQDAMNCSELWDMKLNRTLCVPCHKNTDTYAKRFDLILSQ